ncbi:MAG: efflux RND transporter periplasmic adaptor subunit [Oscillospiraceae bacterium]|nr:efflux RND transporter periplasmic adaptor subunit [Oscillospiraceae bacterium]
MEKKFNPKYFNTNIILKAVIIAVILAAGWFAVFNIPDAVESSLPVVQTIALESVEYCPTVSGTGIITEDTDKHWRVTVSVAERDIRRVKIGQNAKISGAAFEDNVYTAKVYDIGLSAVTQQGEFGRETVVEVVLKIDNPHAGNSAEESRGQLRSGNTARACIHVGETQKIFTLPYTAIMQDRQGEYVFVLEGHSVLRRNIATGVELSDGTQILAGLSGSDRVIAHPNAVTENALASRE